MAYGFHTSTTSVNNNAATAMEAMLAIQKAIQQLTPGTTLLGPQSIHHDRALSEGVMSEALRAGILGAERQLKPLLASQASLLTPTQVTLLRSLRTAKPHLAPVATALSALTDPRRNQSAFSLSSNDLTIDEVIDIARHGRRVTLHSETRARVSRNREVVEALLTPDAPAIYGINTGFGSNAHVRISSEALEQLQTNLIRSHAAGVGNPITDDYVRAMMILRAASLAKAKSGVRPEVIEQLLAFLNHGVHPIVSERGSVGASGDLVPLAQIALALMGQGRVRVHGKEMSAAQALKDAGLQPLKLKAKEGLALINGTQFTTAVTLLNWDQARRLLNMSHVMTALAVEAERGTTTAYRPEIHEARRHGGQELSAQILMKLLTEDGQPSRIGRSHTDCSKVQDPYHLRCAPQVLGAVLTHLSQQGNILAGEINAVTDNPIVLTNGVLSGGNFHAQPIAMAADAIAIALITTINLHQSQIAALLTNTKATSLTAFLVANPELAGIESGLMMLDVAAAGLTSEVRTLSNPASVHSLPTAGGTEDHVSMGPIAARKLGSIVDVLQNTLALGFITVAQGVDLVRRTGEGLQTTHYLESVLRAIRTGVPFMDADRAMTDDITYMSALLASGILNEPFTTHLNRKTTPTPRSLFEGTMG